jgi:hypothetical protein
VANRKPRIKKDKLSLAAAVQAGAFPRLCPRGGHRLESADDVYVVPSSGSHQCRACRAEVRAAYREPKRS